MHAKNNVLFGQMINHIEAEVQQGTWDIVAWWKGSAKKEEECAPLVTSRVHIIKIAKNEPIIRFEPPAPPAPEVPAPPAPEQAV